MRKHNKFGGRKGLDDHKEVKRRCLEIFSGINSA